MRVRAGGVRIDGAVRRIGSCLEGRGGGIGGRGGEDGGSHHGGRGLRDGSVNHDGLGEGLGVGLIGIRLGGPRRRGRDTRLARETRVL